MRIICVLAAKKSLPSRLFYLTPQARIIFDPGKWKWTPKALIYAYTAKLGRSLLHPRTHLQRSIGEKWADILSLNFLPDWEDVWIVAKSWKEVAFMWTVLHKAVAVNQWCHRAIAAIPDLCTCCTANLPELVVHCFYDCAMALPAWKFAASALHRLANTNVTSQP